MLQRKQKMPNKRSQSYSLGDDDISQILQGRIKVVSNTELHKHRSSIDAPQMAIKQILSPYGYFILLYESKASYGHWIAVIQRKPDLIEVFDSYGTYKPDEELDTINPTFKRESGQNYPYLRRMLYDWKISNPNHKVEYNNYPLQSDGNNVATCGRYAVTRILLRDLSLKKFVKAMRGIDGMDPDDVVTHITNSIMAKLNIV
jgi:hypothetical protein